jgi:tight adherence protein C
MTPELVLGVSGAFVAVATLVGWVTAGWLASHSVERRRLHALVQGPGLPHVAIEARAFEQELDPVLVRLSKLLPRKSAKAMTRLQRRLTQAGYASPHVVVMFSLAEAFVPIGAGALTLLAVGPRMWTVALLAAAVGYAAPHLWVDHKRTRRQKAIRNGLPDALDLLTLCVEAGTGLDQAIAKTGEELALAHPALTGELRLMTTEIRAGRPRVEAFQNFAERTGVDDVRSLAGMLIQTDRFGTSIGDALRTHAQTSRTKRRQSAEERAGRVSVKLVFPLVLCLFPALYVVAFGPAALQLFRFFEKGM